MRIRPHHALCAQSFKGRGYNERFVENMRAVLTALDGGKATVTLTDGCDVICSGCPHNDNGICQADGKVRGIDGRAAEALGVRFGDTLPWRELCRKAESTMRIPGKLMEICRDCEWIDFCSRQ